MAALIVDIGGTHLRCGVSHSPHRTTVVTRRRIRPSGQGEPGVSIWQDLVEAIDQFACESAGQVSRTDPLIVSFPGPIRSSSQPVAAPTVGGSEAEIPDLRSMLRRRTGRDVHIINDMSAAAWHITDSVSADRFMVVTVSSGIGSKIVDRDHPKSVLDDMEYAGEIGHLCVDARANAPVCDCGGRGHLGAIASGRGIERFARERAGVDPAFLNSLCVTRFRANARHLNNEEHLVPAFKQNDKWACRIIERCTEPLVHVLLHTVVAAGLQRVVVIGGFALNAGPLYLELLRNTMTRICDYRILERYLDELIVLGDEDACLLGAAAYARKVVLP